eukprot:scaffold1541_cov67-Phaeocystis_antarctica.AAC.9
MIRHSSNAPSSAQAFGPCGSARSVPTIGYLAESLAAQSSSTAHSCGVAPAISAWMCSGLSVVSEKARLLSRPVKTWYGPPGP